MDAGIARVGLVLIFLAATASSAQNPQGAGTLSFPLKSVNKGPLMTRLELGSAEVKFRKEPPFGKDDKIVRKAHKVGPNRDEYLCFAVNLSSRMLYLDLNRNLDLTDDPEGVYSSEQIRGPVSLAAMFRNVRLNLSDAQASRSYLLDPFYALGENLISVGVRSFYEGEVELGGKKWLFQVQDNLDGQFDARDRFLITPVGGSAVAAIPYGPMPVSRNVVVGGRPYRIGFAFASGNAPLTVTFTEVRPRTGELIVDGPSVRRLILQGDTYLAILDPPANRVALPPDNYRIHQVHLQPAAGNPILMGTSETVRIAIGAGAVARLKLGPPLSGIVTAKSGGGRLQLQYILKGAAGEEYSVVSPDRSNTPKFAIYKGDQQLANGSFQFG